MPPAMDLLANTTITTDATTQEGLKFTVNSPNVQVNHGAIKSRYTYRSSQVQ